MNQEQLIKRQVTKRKMLRDEFVIYLSKVEDEVFIDTTVEELTVGFFNSTYAVREIETKLGLDLIPKEKSPSLFANDTEERSGKIKYENN